MMHDLLIENSRTVNLLNRRANEGIRDTNQLQMQ